jgi:outer membrane protein OmpA-like peptidoglycan-associated protein
VIKKALKILGLSLMGILLSHCASKYTPPQDVVVKPCIIPSDLPNDAMGKLGIQIIHIGNTYRIIIPTDNIFETRSGEIKETAYPGLNMLADNLKSFMPTCMKVSGYTDSLGSVPEDISLSDKQVRSLMIFLWTKGVPHECLTPVNIGKDEAKTIASNRTSNGSVTNRRIEITFKH